MLFYVKLLSKISNFQICSLTKKWGKSAKRVNVQSERKPYLSFTFCCCCCCCLVLSVVSQEHRFFYLQRMNGMKSKLGTTWLINLTALSCFPIKKNWKCQRKFFESLEKEIQNWVLKGFWVSETIFTNLVGTESVRVFCVSLFFGT